MPARELMSIALAGALLSACAGAPRLLRPEGAPYVVGPIESITHHATASGLLVRAGPGSLEPCGIVARVDGETRYLRRESGGDFTPASLAELAVGDTVAVYVSGPVAESCPVQGYASYVVLRP